MEPEIIDWSEIESIFVEDDTYGNFDAPKWVDFSAPPDIVDDEAWFCKSGCKHPKTAEDYLKPTRNRKVKLLRSIAISEIFPFRDRTCSSRDSKSRKGETSPTLVSEIPNKESKSAHNLIEDNENKNPNIFTPKLNAKIKSRKSGVKSSTEKKKKMDKSQECSAKGDRKPGLRSTLSAKNLLGGREILDQITDFCSELKRMALKGSKKGLPEKDSSGVSGESRKRVRERERTPLLVVKEECA